MDITITSLQQQVVKSLNEIGAAIAPSLPWLRERLLGHSAQIFQHVDAIALLNDPTASPDLRDWAERFLCGMTRSDAATYRRRRDFQSDVGPDEI